MKIKCPRLTTCSIIAILGGGIILAFGLSLIVFGYSPIYIESMDKTKTSLEQLTSVNLVPQYKVEDMPVGSIKVNFPRLDIFQGDILELTATANDVKPNVKAIAILITDPTLDIRNMTNSQIGGEIEQSKKYKTVIELIPDSTPPFHTSQEVSFLLPYQDVMMHAIVWKEDGFHRIASSQIVTTVLSKVDKIQVETNLQQEKTNKIFIGLGWIGVAIVPILAGVDILLRIRFDSK